MWRYIVRRLLWVVVVLLVVTSITYIVFFVMPSTDPAITFAGKNPTTVPLLLAQEMVSLLFTAICVKDR